MEWGRNRASGGAIAIIQGSLSKAPGARRSSCRASRLLFADASRHRNRAPDAGVSVPSRRRSNFSRSDIMRASIIGLAAVAALFALPGIASATDAGAATGATTGAIAGAIVGGPIGAVIGAGAGAVVGGATSGPETTGSVIVEERPPATREQTCIQDSLGNRTCKEVVR